MHRTHFDTRLHASRAPDGWSEGVPWGHARPTATPRTVLAAPDMSARNAAAAARAVDVTATCPHPRVPPRLAGISSSIPLTARGGAICLGRERRCVPFPSPRNRCLGHGRVPRLARLSRESGQKTKALRQSKLASSLRRTGMSRRTRPVDSVHGSAIRIDRRQPSNSAGSRWDSKQLLPWATSRLSAVDHTCLFGHHTIPGSVWHDRPMDGSSRLSRE